MKLHTAANALALALSLALLETTSGMGCGIGMGNGDGGSRPEMNLPPGCDNAGTVSVEMPDGSLKTFRKNGRSSSSSGGNGGGPPSWAGEDHRDGSSFNYVRGKSGAVFASLVDVSSNEVSQFGRDENGNPTVTTIATNDFPPEADPVDDEDLEEVEPDSEEDIRKRRLLEAEAEISARGDDEKKTPSSSSSSALMLRGGGGAHVEAEADGGRRKLADDLGGNLDVMVPWTKKAECRNSGLAAGCTLTAQTEANMRTRIELAVAETNTAYDLSGVDTQLRLVHAYRDPNYVEASSDAFGQALTAIRVTNDGIMDDVHAKRTLYGADIVAMIIDDAQYCGLGYLGPRIDLMFSVTKWSCATGYYSFGHEIGHNMGCNHDKGTKNACSSTAYNYGWRDPSANFRSILAYNCNSGQCDNNAGGGCTRVQRFSNPSLAGYNGNPIGDAKHDNARRINDVKAEIAGYVPVAGPAEPTPAPAPTSIAPTPSPTPAPTSEPVQPTTPAPVPPPTLAPTRAPVPPTPFPTPAPVAPPTIKPCSSYGGGGECKKAAGCFWDKGVCKGTATRK